MTTLIVYIIGIIISYFYSRYLITGTDLNDNWTLAAKVTMMFIALFSWFTVMICGFIHLGDIADDKEWVLKIEKKFNINWKRKSKW